MLWRKVLENQVRGEAPLLGKKQRLTLEPISEQIAQAGRERHPSTQQHRVDLGDNRCRKARGTWLEGGSRESSGRHNHSGNEWERGVTCCGPQIF